MSQLLDSKLHQDEELLKRSIAGKLGTPGPGAYDIEAHEKSKGYSFAPKPDNDLSIRIGFDPLHKQSMQK